MGTGSVKPCYMSKNLLQGEVFSCFSYPEEQAWVEGLKRTCHAKETFPGAGKLVDHGSGNGFDLSFSPILQNLCDFLQVHLARLISQINRPSSQLLDTFNYRVRTKAVCARSAADKRDQLVECLSLWGDKLLRFHWRSSACQGWDLLLGAYKSWHEPIRTTATHSRPSYFHNHGGFVVLFPP